MKKQGTVVKKLRIDKETLLPLASLQIYKTVAGAAASPVVHLNDSRVIHD